MKLNFLCITILCFFSLYLRSQNNHSIHDHTVYGPSEHNLYDQGEKITNISVQVIQDADLDYHLIITRKSDASKKNIWIFEKETVEKELKSLYSSVSCRKGIAPFQSFSSSGNVEFDFGEVRMKKITSSLSLAFKIKSKNQKKVNLKNLCLYVSSKKKGGKEEIIEYKTSLDIEFLITAFIKEPELQKSSQSQYKGIGVTIDTSVHSSGKSPEEIEAEKQDSINRMINQKWENYFMEKNALIRKLRLSIEQIDSAKITIDELINYESELDEIKGAVDFKLEHEDVWKDNSNLDDQRAFFSREYNMAAKKLEYWKNKLQTSPEKINWLLIGGVAMVVLMMLLPFVNTLIAKRSMKKMQKKQEEAARKQLEEEEKRRLLENIDNDENIIN
jgi:hypothetical protein